MAIPDNLVRWRAFLSASPMERPKPPKGNRAPRYAAAWNEYDEARKQFLNSDITLETKDLLDIRRAVRILSVEASSPATLQTCALAMSGLPSMGKTTAALAMAKEHDRRVRARATVWDDNWQPTIYIVTPPATTPKMLMQAFCRFLGTPYRVRDTAMDMADRVIHELREMRTSLIILDEMHNLQSNRQVGAEAASTLKLFAERLNAVFLYAGVDLQNSSTFTGPIGQQLASRMMHHEMYRYGIRTVAARQEWATLLVSCEDLLCLSRQEEGAILEHYSYLFDRTGGSIGQLRALLRRAAILAIEDGQEHLTKVHLEEVPVGGLRRRAEPFRGTSARASNG